MAKLKAPQTANPAQKEARQLARARHQERILAGISANLPRPKVSPAYQLGLMVVAVAMVVLPLIYLGLIGALAYGLYYHVTHHHTLIKTSAKAFVIFYLMPAVIGLVLIVFLIKPILVRRGRQQSQKRLLPEAEPLIFAYVKRICEAVGAPVPKSIRVDADCNASASFRQGAWSMFRNDLTLTIGLPLVAGMNLRAFSGILAHEFGHFSQGVGMRMRYLITLVNIWFARVVYDRDAWDEWLDQAAKSRDSRYSSFCQLAQGCVWLSRRCVWVLMYAGHAISCLVSRQMEYDADRYEARLVGWETATRSMYQMTELSMAHRKSIDDLQQFWEEGRLGDDLAQVISANAALITPELQKTFKDLVDEQKTGLWDTHPSALDRIASIQAEKAPGIFDPAGDLAKMPATALFVNFEKMSKAVTLQFYKDVLGEEIPPGKLHPVQDLLERQKIEIEAGKSLHRYFQVRIPVLHPLPLGADAIEKPRDPKEAVARVRSCREKMLSGLDAYKKALERYSTAEDKLLNLTGAIALLQAGLKINAAEYGLEESTVEAATSRMKAVRSALQKLSQSLFEFESDAGERLSSALQLLFVPLMIDRVPNGAAFHSDLQQLVPDARFVSGLMADLLPFREVYTSMGVLCGHVEKHIEDQVFLNALISRMKKVHDRLTTIEQSLGDHFYPFDHARPDMTLREFVLPIVPEETDLGGILAVTQRMFERLITVQVRLFARLASIAEKVETALGLPPLPEPPPDPEPDGKKQ